jgi:hypothetical protein
VREHHAVDEFAAPDAEGEGVERGLGEIRPFDATERVVIRQGMEEAERVDVAPYEGRTSFMRAWIGRSSGWWSTRPYRMPDTKYGPMRAITSPFLSRGAPA